MFDRSAFAQEHSIHWRYPGLPDPLLGLYIAESKIEPIILLSPVLRRKRQPPPQPLYHGRRGWTP